MDKEYQIICAKRGSEFLKSTSKMQQLCPECAHILYSIQIVFIVVGT